MLTEAEDRQERRLLTPLHEIAPFGQLQHFDEDGSRDDHVGRFLFPYV